MTSNASYVTASHFDTVRKRMERNDGDNGYSLRVAIAGEHPSYK